MALFFSLFKFGPAQQADVAAYGQRHGPNYDKLKCTKEAPNFGQWDFWNVDHKRIMVGKGKATYDAAKKLLLRWGHFQLGWAEVSPLTAIKPGSPVCVVAKTLFLWTANPLQIMYVDEDRISRNKTRDQGPIQRFQYAHGCMHGHSLAGEERFSIDWDQADDTVWFDIYTISRPAHPVSVLTYPIVRYYQNRFKEDSAALVAKELSTV